MTRTARASVGKPTSLSLDTARVTEVRNLDINISRVAEEGIARAVAEEKARLWKFENREAIESLNDYVEKNGLPAALGMLVQGF